MANVTRRNGTEGMTASNAIQVAYQARSAPGAFRSRLEEAVAAELNEHNVLWEYEIPPVLPDGLQIRYLPDFLIHMASPELELPAWVECKPQDFIYCLRDALDLTRRYGERFAHPIEVTGCGSQELRDRGFSELWKPKRLAELSGRNVLVLGGVGCTSRLSVEMRPDRIVFSRSHPFVNWPAVVRAQEREAQALEHERQAEIARARWEERQRAVARERAIAQQQLATAARQAPHAGLNRYDSDCCSCGVQVAPHAGSLRRLRLASGGSRFMVLCADCSGGEGRQ